MIKLIATDLDGTLLNPGGLSVPPENVEALTKAAEMGIKIVVCTGRMYVGGAKYARLIPGDNPVIAVNGAVIRTSLTREYMRRIPVETDMLVEIMKDLRAENVSPWYYCGDLCYAEQWGAGLDELVARSGAEVEIDPPIEKHIGKRPEKVLAFLDPKSVTRLHGELKAKYAGKLYITQSDVNKLEILSLKATKGAALAEVASAYGIKKEEIMVFGDNYNDLELFEAAGTRIAMGNAQDALKEHANFIAPRNDEAGVAKMMEKLIFEKGWTL